jgi:hypothetical protein
MSEWQAIIKKAAFPAERKAASFYIYQSCIDLQIPALF